MHSPERAARAQWVAPRLVLLGDLADVAGGPAPSTQMNPGGNTPVAGKS